MNGATWGILIAAVIVAAGWAGGHYYGPQFAKACSSISTTVGSTSTDK